jgi:hypothetical protein
MQGVVVERLTNLVLQLMVQVERAEVVLGQL